MRSLIAIIIALAALGILAGGRADATADKVEICHWDNGARQFSTRSVAVASLAGHRLHANDIIPKPASGCPAPTTTTHPTTSTTEVTTTTHPTTTTTEVPTTTTTEVPTSTTTTSPTSTTSTSPTTTIPEVTTTVPTAEIGTALSIEREIRDHTVPATTVPTQTSEAPVRTTG